MKCCRTSLLTRVINYLLEDTEIMATAADIGVKLTSALAELDRIKAVVEALKASQSTGAATQAELDTLDAQAQAILDSESAIS